MKEIEMKPQCEEANYGSRIRNPSGNGTQEQSHLNKLQFQNQQKKKKKSEFGKS